MLIVYHSLNVNLVRNSILSGRGNKFTIDVGGGKEWKTTWKKLQQYKASFINFTLLRYT